MKRPSLILWFSLFCGVSLLVIAAFLQLDVPSSIRTPLFASSSNARNWKSPAKIIINATDSDAALHVRKKMLQKVTADRATKLGLRNTSLQDNPTKPVLLDQSVKLPEQLRHLSRVVKVLTMDGTVQDRMIKPEAVNSSKTGSRIEENFGDYSYDMYEDQVNKLDSLGLEGLGYGDGLASRQAKAKETAHQDHIDEAIAISTSKDIDARSKWQMSQVDKFCRKYNMRSINGTIPKPNSRARHNLFRHVLFDDKRKLLFTYLPKVGCSHTRRFMFVLTGAIPLETIHWKKVSEEKYLGPGVQLVSLANPTLSDTKRLEKLHTYWKFSILRNPLERLLSAFRNKLESPLNFSEVYSNTFQMMKRSIVENYHPSESKKWIASKGSFELVVDFQTYIKWIVDTQNNKLNEHFCPMVHLAQPCRLRYNFYGNFKNFSSDMHMAMKKLNVPTEYFADESHYPSGEGTNTLLYDYYSTLSKELKLALFRDFYAELDFYYHLFPEERGSHVSILGVGK